MSNLDNPILPKDNYIEAIRNSCNELYNEAEKDDLIKVKYEKIIFKI